MVLKDLFLNFIAKSIESYNKGLNNFSVIFIYNNIEENWKYHLASWNQVQEPKGTVAWNPDLQRDKFGMLKKNDLAWGIEERLYDVGAEDPNHMDLVLDKAPTYLDQFDQSNRHLIYLN